MKKRGVRLILTFVLFAGLEELLGILIPDKALNVAFAAMVTVILIGMALVVHGTYVRNRWGINLQQVNCPRCQMPVPKSHHPKSRRERLWGGATCEKCGCEMDKWGNPIVI